jgi:type VI secretion system protein ImpK
MQPDIANVVHSVLGYGLRLRQRADDREPLDIDQEQTTLKQLLLSDTEAQQWVEYGGEAGRGSLRASRGPPAARRGGEQFLGIRYLLVCWLDEVMADSPVGPQWDERPLETALYGTGERAQAFWEQARRAERRSGGDATQVCFLCVMLGFRGSLRDQPEQLQRWVSAVQKRVIAAQGQECPIPAEQDPPINVPPRRGRERLQHVLLVWGAVLLLLIPVAVCYAVRQFVFGP